jgi:Tat protein translocase TatB subunit
VYLFIFESIGTSELILIGVIALIFLGPRKLPQIARTIGRVMSDFRNTTNEFKSTWEREVNFEEEEKALRTGDLSEPAAEPVPRVNSILSDEREEIPSPEVRSIDKESFDGAAEANAAEAEPAPADPSDKKNWL